MSDEPKPPRTALEIYRDWLNESSSSSSGGEESPPTKGPSPIPAPRPEYLPPPTQKSTPSFHNHKSPSPFSITHNLRKMEKHTPAKSPSPSPFRFLRTNTLRPKNPFSQMSFKSFSPQQAANKKRKTKPTPAPPPDEQIAEDSGMDDLFGDAWITQPSKESTLYDVPLHEEKQKRTGQATGWEYHPMDSRRGWWVALGALCVCMVSLSTLATYTVYGTYYENSTYLTRPTKDLPDAVVADPDHGRPFHPLVSHWPFNYNVSMYILLLGSLMSGTAALVAPLAGMVADILGYPVCAFSGTVILCVSLLCASFVARLWALCVLQGVLGGMGVGMMAVPAVVAPSQWFERHRALATGVAISGAAIGVLILAPSYHLILEKYGSAMCLRIQALLTVVVGTLGSVCLRTRVLCPKPMPMDWSGMFKDSRMWVIWMLVLFAAGSRFAQSLCLPFFVQYHQLDQMSVVYLLISVGLAFLVGAIVGGALADATGYVAGIGICECAMAIFTLAIWTPTATEKGPLAPAFIYSVMFGLSSGALASVLPSALAQMMGINRMATFVGWVVVPSAPAILVTMPVAVEFMKEMRAERAVSWVVGISGACSLVAGVLAFWLPVLQKRKKRQSN